MKVDRIQISWKDEDGGPYTKDFYQDEIEEFFSFLLETRMISRSPRGIV